MSNWKSPGSYLMPGFWLKHFTALHTAMSTRLNNYIEKGVFLNGCGKGRTVLILKDQKIGNNFISTYMEIANL